ncbi:polyketide synthase [Apiospora arundinis]
MASLALLSDQSLFELSLFANWDSAPDKWRRLAMTISLNSRISFHVSTAKLDEWMGDARSIVPESRYNVASFYSPTKKPGHVISKYGYFLDDDLGALDTSFFPMARSELEVLDPQQRLLFEVTKESLDDAGEVGSKGKNIGVYVGSFGNDWYDLVQKESQRYGTYHISNSHDYALSNRVSYEMDWHGPSKWSNEHIRSSITIRTACSSSLVALNEACTAISRGECSAAVVGGTSIIAGPSLVIDESNQGTMSPDGSCKTFSAQADGYGRGEGIVALFVKPLEDALRDGNPVRAVITGASTNSDGKTSGFTLPSADAQESLIRRTYQIAGIPPSQIAKTGFFECHGTGTQRGDTVEASAIAKVFGGTEFLHLGSVKPNLGHGEGVSGLTAVIKAVLSLENHTIAPNIKSLPLNANIPFSENRLIVPTEATPWPEGRDRRVSVNSFGIGGSNAHVIIEAPALDKRYFPPTAKNKMPANAPHLLVYSAQSEQSLKGMIDQYNTFLEDPQDMADISNVAYTLANRRDRLQYLAFTVRSRHQPGITSVPSLQPSTTPPFVAMVFTGQGAQWPQIGRDLFRTSSPFSETIKSLDGYLQALGPDAPDWKLEDELLKPGRTSRVNEAEFSQPLCTAIQIALVNLLTSVGVRPLALVGHSSGEIAAAYAAGGLTARDAIVVAFYRGTVSKKQRRPGAMAAVGLGWNEVERFLIPGVVVACDNSPKSTTLSGDAHLLEAVLINLRADLPTTIISTLKVEKAYHSHHMIEIGDEYCRKMINSGNTRESFLMAMGKLWAVGAEIDFNKLAPPGKCLSDLPRYPWNHQHSYWKESRVVKEWRLTPYPYHDLLGTRVPESSGVEPVWRNLLHLETVPWLRDHKIKDDIIFPFAGYVSMAAEAVRQAAGAHKAVELRHVVVDTALVLNEHAPTELVTTIRKHRLTDSLESAWWEFTIAAHNGHVWTRHCSGQVCSSTKVTPNRPSLLPPESLPHNVKVRQWYNRVSRGGLRYGPDFQTIKQLKTTTNGPKGSALAEIESNLAASEKHQYYVHPVVLDTFFQVAGAAAHHGFTHAYTQAVPSRMEYLALWRCNSSSFTLSANMNINSNPLVGDGWGFVGSDSTVCLEISGLRVATLDPIGANEKDAMPLNARCTWVPWIDFVDFHVLMKPVRNHAAYLPTLDQLGSLGIALFQSKLLSASRTDYRTSVQLQKYVEWVQQQPASEEMLNETALMSQIETLLSSLMEGPLAPVAAAIAKLCGNASSILSGEVGPLVVLHTDNTMDNLSSFLYSWDISKFLNCLCRCKPDLHILELGTGLGPSLKEIVNAVRQPDGEPMFSTYVYTERSTDMLKSAEAHFQMPNLEFACLDISEDPAEQGFQDRRFDLVIARGAIHTTRSLQQTLKHVRGLLRSDGHLLLQQPRSGLAWHKFILGAVPGWWCGSEDSRDGEPHVDVDRWDQYLRAAGFDGVASKATDAPEPFDLNTVMLVRPQVPQKSSGTERVTLLHRGPREDSDVAQFREILETEGWQVACSTIDSAPKDQNMIAVLDKDEPFLGSLDDSTFERFRDFLEGVSNSKGSILWVTKPSQVSCRDPDYAPIIGLARTLRVEMGLDIATCELDDFRHSPGLDAVVSVFHRFQERDHHTGTDFEYSVMAGVIRVNRVFPVLPEEEAKASCETDHGSVAMKIDRPGSLDSLQWVTRPERALVGNEVEIEVRAVGVNFRDVLETMGIIECADPERIATTEGSGVIRRIGPDVTEFRMGDRVMALGYGFYSTTVISTDLLCAKLPDDIHWTHGASMPVVFLTAIQALLNIGRLERGQTVLIHSGCGGVGLAAIQIAQMVGAVIYTTVGSDTKASYLIETLGLPKSHIFNSRSAHFRDEILRETSGRGVDLALNSLSGDLLHATWHCVAKWGTMVEIGKVDLLGAGKLDMGVFLGNRSYSCFDLQQLITERPQKGSPPPAIKPLAKLDPSASYLLVGGLGGLGRSVAIWMAQRGARNLTLLSRSLGDASTDSRERDFVRMLGGMGCTVQLIRGSVTSAEDVAHAIDQSPNPVKGMIHMAMVLRDQAFRQMKFSDWAQVMAPKVKGAWNLHTASCNKGLGLDFFVLFSSLSGVLGQPGQAPYSAANAYLDAFVHYRTGMGLPCTTLDLGAMEGVGYLSSHESLLDKMRGTGWIPVKEEQLLEALESVLIHRHYERTTRTGFDASHTLESYTNTNTVVVGIAPDSSDHRNNGSTRLHRDVRLAAYRNKGRSRTAVASSSSDDGLRNLLVKAKDNPELFSAPETAEVLAREIGKKLFSLILKPNQEPNIALGLTELGLDSLVAVELRAWCKAMFAVEISVLQMLAMGTLKALGEKVAERLASIYAA